MDATLRLAITLHVIDDRPVAEVAKMMDASVVATKTRVWRARRHLEKCARRDPSLEAFLSRRAAPPDGESERSSARSTPGDESERSSARSTPGGE
jgi:hypothetical protein